MHYDAIGSEGGIARLTRGESDFAASDIRIGADEFYAGGKPKYLRFPTVLGAVVPTYNLPEVRGDLRFTPQILAGIYLGHIRRWNDPLIAEANRGASLPDREIAVVHRSDGSGTTYVWTDYLSGEPRLEIRGGRERFSAMACGHGCARQRRRGEAGAGYSRFDRLRRVHLRHRQSYDLRQRTQRRGPICFADLESITVAAQGSPGRIAEDLQTSITNAEGPGAYPIAAFSWFVIPAAIDDAGKKRAVRDLLRWILGPGQNEGDRAGYLAIPRQIVDRELRLRRDSF